MKINSDIIILTTAIIISFCILSVSYLDRNNTKQRLTVLENKVIAQGQIIGAIEQDRINKRAEALRKIRSAKEMKEK